MRVRERLPPGDPSPRLARCVVLVRAEHDADGLRLVLHALEAIEEVHPCCSTSMISRLMSQCFRGRRTGLPLQNGRPTRAATDPGGGAPLGREPHAARLAGVASVRRAIPSAATRAKADQGAAIALYLDGDGFVARVLGLRGQCDSVAVG
jgi:hypothetical protein